MSINKKAVALMSGGLDSILAAKVIMMQGVHVEGVHFMIGFAKPDAAIKAAKFLGIKLHLIDAVADFQEVLASPKHGYGAHLNPCLDCKIFMVRKAKEWMVENGFDFIITGEVLGQRPKSQRRDTLPVIERESGANDLLVRPLCAKLLPLTAPERNGWIERELLYDIQGRSRKTQIKLAREFGITDYPTPAGGCLLTENKFCDRLRDLWKMRGESKYDKSDIELLKIGRHLRLTPTLKIIVGRNERENDLLKEFCNNYVCMETVSHPGPLALVIGDFDDIAFIAKIIARFSAGRLEKSEDVTFVQVRVKYLDGRVEVVSVKPMSADKVEKEWYI